MSSAMSGTYYSDYFVCQCVCGYPDETENDYDHYGDGTYYSAQLSMANRINIRYWDKSDYLVLEHNMAIHKKNMCQLV